MSVPLGSLDSTVRDIVNDLLAGEPHALAATKTLLHTPCPLWRSTKPLSGRHNSPELFASDEAREGMSAFLEKRPASWVERLPDVDSH